MAQTQEINIPVADPSDPYANPAAMPSSADRAPRSFDIEAFAKPDRKQEDWRYTPIERIEEFFAERPRVRSRMEFRQTRWNTDHRR